MNLPGRRAAQKQILTSNNLMDRLGFAYQHQHWNATDWSNVVFTDEKIFSVDESGEVWLHRPRGKRYESRYVHPRRKSGRFSVAIWGWMTASGPGEIVRIEGNLNSSQYVDILQNSFLPAAEALFGPGTVLPFVQDRSPVHTSQYTKRWLQNHSIIDVINWPAKAADLNPIENLWARMAADCNFHQAGTTDDIWNTIQQQWNSFRESNYCEILVNSLPRRLEDVIANGGFWTKY